MSDKKRKMPKYHTYRRKKCPKSLKSTPPITSRINFLKLFMCVICDILYIRLMISYKNMEYITDYGLIFSSVIVIISSVMMYFKDKFKNKLFPAIIINLFCANNAYIIVSVLAKLTYISVSFTWVNLLNIFIYFTLYMVLFAVTNSIRISMILGNILCFAVGAANYYISLIRGSLICAADFFSIGTILNMLDSYDLTMSDIVLQAIVTMVLVTILILVVCKKAKKVVNPNEFIENRNRKNFDINSQLVAKTEEVKTPKKRYIKQRVAIVLSVIICYVLLWNTKFINFIGIEPLFFDYGQNGFALNCFLQLKDKYKADNYQTQTNNQYSDINSLNQSTGDSHNSESQRDNNTMPSQNILQDVNSQYGESIIRDTGKDDYSP